MKLISLNIGIKINNTPQVIHYLKEQDADIIMLQESMRAFEENTFKQFHIGNDIEKAFKKSHPYTFFAPLFISNAITQGESIFLDFGGKAEQGTHILSKYPIIFGENQFYYNNYRYGFDATHFKEKDWARSIQTTILTIGEQKLKCINVHGIWNKSRQGDARTQAQCNFILKEAQKEAMPVIIAGDFNLSPNSPSLKELNAQFCNLTTQANIKSTRPNFNDELDIGRTVVDYIFTNTSINVESFNVEEANISDHYPLTLEFTL